MKALLLLVLVGLVGGVSLGRPVRIWSHQEMLEKADLVLIAKPLSTKETGEISGGNGGWPAMVGIATTFEVVAVLKGDKALKQVTLSHYRLRKASDEVEFIDGPALLKLDLKEGRAYLLYLHRDTDERYTPLSGQIDPGSSILKLEEATH
ncbi:MAG TPA: hypothetical protein VGO11_23100 [Chthoniobacteraceae bacterium]|jgi:hypothetical protein|nr:hypothetical protein [Chthoniobacteraceae bacterium]